MVIEVTVIRSDGNLEDCEGCGEIGAVDLYSIVIGSFILL